MAMGGGNFGTECLNFFQMQSEALPCITLPISLEIKVLKQVAVSLDVQCAYQRSLL